MNRLIADIAPEDVNRCPCCGATTESVIAAVVRAVEQYGLHPDADINPPSPPAREHRPGARGITWPKPRKVRR